MKPKFGYCAVTADLLHYGHIRFLKKCAEKCDKLIVGIMTDEIVSKYKGRDPVIPQDQRREVVDSIRCVAKTTYQDEFEFGHTVQRLKDFYGDDFIVFCSDEHNRRGADVIIPRTKGISSSIIKNLIHENLNYS